MPRPEDISLESLGIKKIETIRPYHRRGFLWAYYNAKLDIPATSVGIYHLAVVNEFHEDAEDWACYIGASMAGAQSEVKGVDHVASYGTKLPERIARKLFPRMQGVAYRH